jgi:hypothetical protein
MGLDVDFGPLVRAVVDLGSESYEKRVRKMIWLGAAVALGLILIMKTRIKWLT